MIHGLCLAACRSGAAVWGATYWLLTLLSTQLPPAVVYMTGIGWALAGVVSFGYIRKLRREMDAAEGRGSTPGPA